MTTAHTAQPQKVPVALGDCAYDIFVGPDLIADAARYVAPLLARPRTVIITDSDVAAHYLGRLEAALKTGGIATESIVLAPGEATKSFAVLQDLLSQLLDLGIERRDTIIALGGGVVGDVTGFAASILRRGVPFIQVPTSLLAQVDSSVGGKTGINMPQGKNLVGTFCQPRLVLADTTTLASLDKRQFLAGYAEVVKYGLLGDAAFFDWLETHGPALVAGDAAARQTAVVRSCEAKAAVVAADEREAGRRGLLNLGHTFAHVLEAEAGYSDRLLHGEAVAIGMALAFDLSVRLGFCPPEDAARVRRHLEAVGLRVSPKAAGIEAPPERLIARMGQDKKVRDGRLTFVLVKGIGQAFLTQDVAEAAIVETLKEAGK